MVLDAPGEGGGGGGHFSNETNMRSGVTKTQGVLYFCESCGHSGHSQVFLLRFSQKLTNRQVKATKCFASDKYWCH